ncbi:MAG: hypothetical protein U0794_11655 [Isosphaeraceae bacterium]
MSHKLDSVRPRRGPWIIAAFLAGCVVGFISAFVLLIVVTAMTSYAQ